MSGCDYDVVGNVIGDCRCTSRDRDIGSGGGSQGNIGSGSQGICHGRRCCGECGSTLSGCDCDVVGNIIGDCRCTSRDCNVGSGSQGVS